MVSAPNEYEPEIKWDTNKLFLVNADNKESLNQMINNVIQTTKIKFAINDQNMLAVAFFDKESEYLQRLFIVREDNQLIEVTLEEIENKIK